MSINKKFGIKLKELRHKKGYSQEKLAEKSGLHRTYISSIERGKRNITISNVEKLAKALGCEISDFF